MADIRISELGDSLLLTVTTFNWRGPWNTGATYQVFDVVFYNGSSYVAIDINTDTPPTQINIGTMWEPLALSGAAGPQGPQGVAGVAGIQGSQGPQGPQGVTGVAGIQGPQGVGGASGLQGDPGEQGEQGIQGIQGEPGEQGIQGEPGVQGDKGDQGQGFIWRNTWVDSITYSEYDVVAYNGGTYVCIAPNVLNVIPDSDITKWDLMASGFESTQVQADWDAVSGAAEILNKPTLGTAASQDSSAFDAAGTATAAVAIETARAETAEALLVPQTITVNGHALSSNVTIAAGDISGLGNAATLSVGNTAGTVAAGDDPRFALSIVYAIALR